MSAIFGGGGSVGAKKPQYTGLQVQTSSSILVLPLLWGAQRIAPNLIWYDDFKAIRKEEKTGGKGGSPKSVSYTYSASFLMSLCEGPILGIGSVWKDKELIGGTISSVWTFPATDVDAGADRVTTNRDTATLAQGGGPFQLSNTGGSLPGGLSGGTDYWLIVSNPSGGDGTEQLVKFATSKENAAAGIAVPISSAGTGTNQALLDGSAVYSTLGFDLFTGADPQSPWSYLTTAHPDAALNYNGVSYLATANYDLGNQASLPNHTFEVYGPLANTAIGGTSIDAEPAALIDDMLTNLRYGANFPSDMIDDDSFFSGPDATTTGDSAYETYCRAIGFGLSPALSDASPAAEVLDRWCMLTNSAPVWSGAVLKIIPYGDEVLTANGVTFLPATTVCYALTEADFVFQEGEDPVKVTRSDQADAFNHIRVMVKSRADGYNSKPAEAKDLPSIDLFGIRSDQPIDAYEIGSLQMGGIVAQLILQRKVYIRNEYRFQLSVEYCRLEPMDVVTLTSPIMQLSAFPVRIREIEEDEDGILQVLADEFPEGVASASAYPIQAAVSPVTNLGAYPGNTNAPIIFEPFGGLTNGTPQVWIAVSGPSDQWGGCHVWISTDDATYRQIGTVDNPARTGDTTATLPAYGGANPDTVNTLSVDLAESHSTLESTSAMEAENGLTLCYVDGELLSYTTATLDTGNAYDLTDLYRGLYGTSPSAHSSGVRFAFLDDSIFKYTLPEEYVGVPLYLKFTSFNLVGAEEQSLTDVASVMYSPNGNGFEVGQPGALTITPQVTTNSNGVESLALLFDWGDATDTTISGYELQWSTDGGSTYTGVSTSKDQSLSLFTGALPETTYDARVRSVRTSGVFSASVWVDATPTSSGPLAGGAAVVYNTPTNGFSITIADGVGTEYLTPAGTLATGTITMPPNPSDNQRVSVFTTNTVTALTVAANTGHTITGQPTTLAANAGFTMVFRTSDLKWYRI